MSPHVFWYRERINVTEKYETYLDADGLQKSLIHPTDTRYFTYR